MKLGHFLLTCNAFHLPLKAIELFNFSLHYLHSYLFAIQFLKTFLVNPSPISHTDKILVQAHQKKFFPV